ncbi:MAG: hypothetical protein QOG83_2769 [Alphaproteobacteria bacterium]|nr:hypothetical protein [Alphaproteobacteria bacterium]
MKSLFALAASAAVLGVAGTSAPAEPLPMQRFLPLSVAIEAASAALKECIDKGHHVSVEVMNHNAMVLVTYHHELATIHSAYSAHAKAFTVLSYSYASGETTSAEIAQRLTRNPADVARIQGIPGLILSPGAVLIQFGQQTVGAIGVGGSSGPVNDELCAKAGIAKIKERLQ